MRTTVRNGPSGTNPASTEPSVPKGSPIAFATSTLEPASAMAPPRAVAKDAGSTAAER